MKGPGDDYRQRPLRVVGFIATRSSDPERGPLVTMHPDDARTRLQLLEELAPDYVTEWARLLDRPAEDVRSEERRVGKECW